MMKLLFQLFACVVIALCALGFAHASERRRAPGARPSEIDTGAMLAALSAVESGNNNRAVGRCGERSAWQIMPRTWARYTRHPHLLASQRQDIAREVAAKHLDWLMETLRRSQAHCEPEMIAAAWRHGPGLAPTFVRSDYAKRVGNLYREAIAKKGTP